MFAPTASRREPAAAFPARLPVANRHVLCPPRCTTLTVTRVGHLVAAASVDGTVHSVFARACNIACPFGLLTVAAGNLADGPTVWRLAGSGMPDFRGLFRPGERLVGLETVAFTRDVTLDLSGATVWRPSPWPALSSQRLGARLELVAAEVDRHRRLRSSVIDREARASLSALEDACRRLDIERATAEIHRLVGWGEGLTPAGDDALVGLLASFGALARTSMERFAFLQSLSAAVVARVARTTAVSGHYLRLAVHGHFTADVRRLAEAFLCDDGDDRVRLRDAVETALDVGATSGADMVAGMIAGFRAWTPANG